MAVLADKTERSIAISVITESLARSSFSERAITALRRSMTKQAAATSITSTPTDVESYGASTEQWSALKAVS
jgi:hypothetical protein